MGGLELGLFIGFQTKHYVADFLLQTSHMLKKGDRHDWALPLLSHCLVHGIFTLLIVLWASPSLWWIALIEIGAHFGIDRWKAVFTRDLPFDHAINIRAFGFDQFLHQITYGAMLWYISNG